MAKIFELNDERMCILGVREGVVQPFLASAWTDLRIGMFLSLTSNTTDNDQSGLDEVLLGTDLPPADRHWIGVKSQTLRLPFESETPFIGFTNTDPAANSHTSTGQLLPSDNGAIYTPSGNYWRSQSATHGTFGIYEGTGRLAASVATNSSDNHFIKTPITTEFCTLVGFRMLRSNPDSNHITVHVPHYRGGFPNLTTSHSSDIMYTDDPSKENLDTTLETWNMGPLGANKLVFGPVTMTVVPNSFFCYWPYRESRLRIHCWGMFKNA